MKRAFILSTFFLSVLFVRAQRASENVIKTMQSYIDSGEIPGIFYLVADANKILEEGGVGYADIGTKYR